MPTTFIGPDGQARCPWAGAAPEFLGYHDAEWGRPVSDDRRLFEKLCLEGFQSGLSWRTILSKRPHHSLPARRYNKIDTRSRLPPPVGLPYEDEPADMGQSQSSGANDVDTTNDE